MLSFFHCHLFFLGTGLQDQVFHQVLKAIAKYGKKMGFSKAECITLGAQVRKFSNNRSPFDIEFVPGAVATQCYTDFQRALKPFAAIGGGVTSFLSPCPD